jgi:hypothetical protein
VFVAQAPLACQRDRSLSQSQSSLVAVSQLARQCTLLLLVAAVIMSCKVVCLSLMVAAAAAAAAAAYPPPPDDGDCNCVFQVQYLYTLEPKAKLTNEFVAPTKLRIKIDDMCFPGEGGRCVSPGGGRGQHLGGVGSPWTAQPCCHTSTADIWSVFVLQHHQHQQGLVGTADPPGSHRRGGHCCPLLYTMGVTRTADGHLVLFVVVRAALSSTVLCISC